MSCDEKQPTEEEEFVDDFGLIEEVHQLFDALDRKVSSLKADLRGVIASLAQLTSMVVTHQTSLTQSVKPTLSSTSLATTQVQPTSSSVLTPSIKSLIRDRAVNMYTALPITRGIIKSTASSPLKSELKDSSCKIMESSPLVVSESHFSPQIPQKISSLHLSPGSDSLKSLDADTKTQTSTQTTPSS